MFIQIFKKLNLALLSVCILFLILGFFVSVFFIIFKVYPISFVVYNYINLLVIFVCSFIVQKLLDKN
jgi:hypothetical protein